MSEPIRVEGMNEWNRALRRLDSEAPKALRIAHNKAAQIVVDTARPRVPLGPGKGGHAKDSIRVASTRTSTRVKAGSKRIPYYPWLDFGGSVGPKRSVRRPFIKEGRYIFAAYNDNKPEIADTLKRELEAVINAAGLGD